MARFGVEGVRNFRHACAAGMANLGDFTYTFNRCNGFDNKLRSANHARYFYWGNTDCWETDIRDVDQGGDDVHWVDNVDIFWIETHGNRTSDGEVALLYDSASVEWYTVSSKWQLGEKWFAEWVMAYSCLTVDRNKVGGLWNMFAGLHIYCGAYDVMYDGLTTDECGEDVGDDLIDRDTVSESWIGGVSDWWVDNHPITVCVGDAETWNDGAIQWERSFLNRDHLWGHGNVEPDLPPQRQACILWQWAEG
jgi:hypothetical protein